MDPFIVSLLATIINIYVVILFIRMFMTESERFEPIFDMVYKVTEPVIGPLGLSRRSTHFNFTPLVPILILLLVKGMIASSIPRALLEFADRIFQLYVLILIIISGFREYYTNPIVSFSQRMINPVRTLVAGYSRQVLTVNMLAIALLLIVHIVVSLILTSFILPDFAIKLMVVRSLDLILSLMNVFIWAIIINAFLSWISPDPLNPIVQLLTIISAPIVHPIRRFVPPLGGMFDLSPLIAIVLLSILWSIGGTILSSI